MPGPKPKLKVGLHKPLKILVSETNVMKKGSEKDVTWIDFTWGPIQDDNCLMQGALFRIVSDGGAGFYAEVQTTDSGDVWLVQGLGLLKKKGVGVFLVPQ